MTAGPGGFDSPPWGYVPDQVRVVTAFRLACYRGLHPQFDAEYSQKLDEAASLALPQVREQMARGVPQEEVAMTGMLAVPVPQGWAPVPVFAVFAMSLSAEVARRLEQGS